MPKIAKELGALAVKQISGAGLHFVGGVPGLALHVSESGARSWLLRVMVGEKRREMGLGPFPAVPLAEAREKARAARERISQGQDPIRERSAARSAQRSAQLAERTFEHCARAYIAAKSPEWRNAKHAAQWTATLETYAFPKIGSLLAKDVGLPQVRAVLDPIWTTKTETASRVRGRVEAVLDWATVNEYRTGPNPARWRGHLDKLLPARGKVTKVQNREALPLGEMGAFIERLRASEGLGARALEFAILTAGRSNEVRGAKWSEIDLEAGVWTVPAERMKAGREHRVPLSEEAKALLGRQPRFAGDDLVFSHKGRPLSDMAMVAVTRRMGVAAVPHGFRSTFRDWASERTNYPRDAAEMALAHAIGDKVEAAYRRGDLFEKRRLMMQDWAKFIAKPEPSAEVVPMPSKAAA